MKLEMCKKYVQIDFTSTYNAGSSIGNVQGIAGLSIPTKVQVAAQILLEAISKNREARELVKIAEKRNKAFCYTMSSCGDSIAGFTERFIKADASGVGTAKVIKASELARAARLLRNRIYRCREIKKINKEFVKTISKSPELCEPFDLAQVINHKTRESGFFESIFTPKIVRAARCLLKEKYDNTD